MQVRRLPGTDLDLSVVGFGAWAVGGDAWGDDVTEERSIAAVHAALDAGITWFDTAPIYGWGRSEELLRKALGPRLQDVIVATKVGVVRGPDGHAHSHLTPQTLRADLEGSLRRLGVDTIDLLQIHWPCEHDTPLEQTLEALAQLREEGRFRYLGVCNYGAEALDRAAEIGGIVSLQTGYSLLRRELEGPLRDTAVRHGLGILAYEPLCRGLLSGRFTHVPSFPETDLRSRDDRFKGARFHHAQRLTADLSKVARRIGVPTAAVAIGWVAAQPGITAVIAGAKGPEQVQQNAQAARLVGQQKLWDVVGRIAAVHGGTPR
ncbi:MAG: aldo/keto reductase [Alphaproteobacteria bacterium]|nr:aldo/keto reductase [Alphaproteobacteria bacterium]